MKTGGSAGFKGWTAFSFFEKKNKMSPILGEARIRSGIFYQKRASIKEEQHEGDREMKECKTIEMCVRKDEAGGYFFFQLAIRVSVCVYI